MSVIISLGKEWEPTTHLLSAGRKRNDRSKFTQDVNVHSSTQISIRMRITLFIPKTWGDLLPSFHQEVQWYSDTVEFWRSFIEKHECINVNSKIHMVHMNILTWIAKYILYRYIRRNEREIKMKMKAKQGTKLLKAPHRTRFVSYDSFVLLC